MTRDDHTAPDGDLSASLSQVQAEPVRFRWVHLKRINRLAFIHLERDGRLNRYPLQAVTL